MIAKEFAHYRIDSRIGQGGMGEVYVAEDLTLNRRVALKFLLPVAASEPGASASPGDGEGRRRLLREARAAAQLDHPFICKVYEVGEHDGRAFFAMEFVEGVTLKARLATGHLTMDEALRIGGEIAEALHFAHSRGIVHRDVKPANVMLAADGHVKVMDFGVAKRMVAPPGAEDVTAGAATATLPGEPTGTLAYMSPEQLRGEPVDARSDVFAFGVLLHELLTGAHPFKRSSSLETAHAILHETAPPLEQSLPGAPPLLAHLVSRCLEKDRTRRYESLGDVRLEMDAAQKPPVSGDARSQGRRRRWIAAVAALTLVLAAGIATSWLRPWSLLSGKPALAFQERDWIIVADFNNLTNDPVFDKSLRLALEVAIAQSQDVNVYPPARVAAALQRMQKKPERFDEALASEVAVRDGIRGVLACDIAQIGNVYALTARLIDPKTRAAVLTDQVQARNKDAVLDALGDVAARVRSSLGESLAGLPAQIKPLPMVTTSSLEALKLYAEALSGSRDQGEGNALLRQAIALDADFALAYAELGRRYYLEGERATREQGEQLFAKALQLTDRLSLRERLWIQAVAEDSRGNRQQAAVAYKAYLAQYPDDPNAWFRLAWTQMATLGQFSEAAEGFKQVIRLQPNDLGAHINLASAYSGMEDVEAAIPAYQKAFTLEPAAIFGTFVNHEYGFTLIRAGRLAEAEVVFGRMKIEGELHAKAKGHRSLALLQMYRGQYASASEELRGAIVLDQTYKEAISEFRDRMYLVTALDARDQRPEADAAWREVDRLINRLSLSPNWLWQPVRWLARRGQLRDAQRIVALMEKTAGSATADSSVARNMGLDRAYVNLAQAEIELASGRAARAVELLEPTRDVLKQEMVESLAAAYASAGRLPAAIGLHEEFMRGRLLLGNELQQIWLQSHASLGALYERVARPDDARRVYSALVEQWKDGDSDLVLLRTVRERLSKLSPRAGAGSK